MTDFVPTDNRAIIRQQERSDELKRAARETELNDLAAVMSTESGRRFIWRIMEMSAIYRNAFTGNSETYVNCGRQLIGQTLLRDFDTDQMHDQYMLMQIEARKRAKEKCAG